jgi:hypothetical protein
VPGQYDNDDGPAAGGERLGGPIFEGVYFTSRYIRNIASKISTKYRLKPRSCLRRFRAIFKTVRIETNFSEFGGNR